MSNSVRLKKPLVLDELTYDRSGVIEASAGTGKTHTIERMVVDLILEEDVRITNILVVTFTERATAELVSRVREILNTIIAAEEDTIEDPSEPHWVIDDEARERLNRALLNFDRAPVHTIHSFCNRILNEHAFPNCRPFQQEKIDSGELFERIFPEVLREVLAKEPDYVPVLRAYISDNGLDSLKQTVRRSTGTWEEIRPRMDLDRVESMEGTLNEFVEQFPEAEQRIRRALKNGEVGGRSADKIERILEAFRSAVEEYREYPSVWTFKGTLDRKLSSRDDPIEYFAEAKADKDWMPELLPQSLRPLLGVHLEPRDVVINHFAQAVEDRLEQEKNEEGVYTYDDMLEMVEEGLQGPSSEELIETLRSEFQYAIIDEFQDTDPRQWTIFRRIFYESGVRNPCYLIGDPKQAIYGFRGADVRTYRRATDRVREDNDGANWVSLDTNYRSTPELIRAYNKILGPDETGSFFDPEGNNTYEEPVDSGFDQKWFGSTEEEASTPVIVPSVRHPHDEGVKARSYERLVGQFYAGEINRLIQGESPRISDDKGGGAEPLSGEDVFVLVNRSREARMISRYLQAEDIPYSFYKEEGLFECEQARHLFHVLQASLDPGDRSRRLGAWHSPFFDVDLKDLRTTDRVTEEDHPLYQRLARWNSLAENGRIGRLIHSVLHRSGVLRRAIYRYPGERALTNYQQLGDRLIHWWQEDSLTGEELVARLGRLVRGEQKPGEEENDTKHVESDRSAVQIMTMHKAKGLEAPVVFLYGGWGRGTHSAYNFYPEGSDERVKYFGSKSRHYDRIEQYQREEDERLLYVAMTRAEGRLYLPYVRPEERGSSPGGRIRVLFDRLEQVLESDGQEDGASNRELIETVEPDLPDRYPPIPDPAEPSASELALPEGIETFENLDFGTYRANRQLYIESYSSVTRARESRGSENDEEFLWGEKQPLSTRAEREGSTLPAGRIFGQFVHDLFEHLDYERVEECRHTGGLESWGEDPEVRSLLERTRSKYGIDSEYDDAVLQLLWRTLTQPIDLPDGRIEALSAVPDRQEELEFWVPIPEEGHPSPTEDVPNRARTHRDGSGAGETAVPRQPGLFGSSSVDRPFSVERGYLRGYVDYVFAWNGRIYAADWKTDSFDNPEDYAPDVLAQHVEEDYRAQQIFYTYALMRLVQRSGDPLEDRFGGLFYFFVRGLSLEDRDPRTGVYFFRPDPSEYASIVKQTESLAAESIQQKKAAIRRDE